MRWQKFNYNFFITAVPAQIAPSPCLGKLAQRRLQPPLARVLPYPLQGLQLDQYFSLFVREEIDLSIVHALTAEDLASIGITQRAHQQSFLAAGQKLAQARRTAQQQPQRQKEGSMTLGSGRPAQQQPSAVQQQHGEATLQIPAAQRPGWGAPLVQPQQRQQATGGAQPPAKARTARGSHQSLLQVWQANSAAQAGPAAGAQNAAAQANIDARHVGPWQLREQPPAQAQSDLAAEQAQQDASLAGVGTRPTERALLAALYPASVGGPSHPHAQQQHQPAPVLRPSMVGAAERVPAGATLWDAAAECRQVAPGMEARLARRRAEAGLDDSAPAPPLARGGTAYPQVRELCVRVCMSVQ
jgi:hypothetical protein